MCRSGGRATADLGHAAYPSARGAPVYGPEDGAAGVASAGDARHPNDAGVRGVWGASDARNDDDVPPSSRAGASQLAGRSRVPLR